MSKNFLKLNEDKSEIPLVGPKPKREMLHNNLSKLSQWIKPKVTSLGVVLNSDLSFSFYINKVTKTLFSTLEIQIEFDHFKTKKMLRNWFMLHFKPAGLL